MTASATTKPTPHCRLRFGQRGGLAGFLFVAPSIIFLIVFVILPIVMAFYYSLTDYDLLSPPRGVGLRNIE